MLSIEEEASSRRGGRGGGNCCSEGTSSSNQRNENREPNTLNPVDRSGNILKNFNCNSVKHLVNTCPNLKDISTMSCHECSLLGYLVFKTSFI